MHDRSTHDTPPHDTPTDFEFDAYSIEVSVNPYPFYRTMREHHPVLWCESTQAWALSRYDDVLAALLDPTRRRALAARSEPPILPNTISCAPSSTRPSHGERSASTSDRCATSRRWRSTSSCVPTSRSISGRVSRSRRALTCSAGYSASN